MGHSGKLRYHRQCGECGLRFRATRRHARFCCAACRSRAHRAGRAIAATPRSELRLTLRRYDAMLVHDLLSTTFTEDLSQYDQDAYARILQAIETADR